MEANPNNQLVKDCYCKQQSITDIKNDSQIYHLCFETYVKSVWNIILSILTGCVIIIVNFILKIILKKLSKFSRYSTVTQEISGTTIKLFIAIFVNTALITLIVKPLTPRLLNSSSAPSKYTLLQTSTHPDIPRSRSLSISRLVFLAPSGIAFLLGFTPLAALSAPTFATQRNCQAAPWLGEEKKNQLASTR